MDKTINFEYFVTGNTLDKEYTYDPFKEMFIAIIKRLIVDAIGNDTSLTDDLECYEARRFIETKEFDRILCFYDIKINPDVIREKIKCLKNLRNVSIKLNLKQNQEKKDKVKNQQLTQFALAL